MIDVSYTPPEEGYQPPYYRAVSTVTLTCRAVGATGQIRYHWSSTCSSCFVPGGYYYSRSGSSISQSVLRSHDAGTHTCSAYDSDQGISDSASTVMNIVGEYLYACSNLLQPQYKHNNQRRRQITRSVGGGGGGTHVLNVKLRGCASMPPSPPPPKLNYDEAYSN